MSPKCQLLNEVTNNCRSSRIVHRNDIKQAVDSLYSVKYHCKRFTSHGTCNEKLLINNIITAINVMGYTTVCKHVECYFNNDVAEFYYTILQYIDSNFEVKPYNKVFYDFIIMNNT